MKNELSSIELKHVLDEMGFLEGARLDKIIQHNHDFCFNFYAKAKGNFMLRIVPGKYVYMTGRRPSNTGAGNFCLSLRKYIINATLESAGQLSSERIVRLSLSTKEGRYLLFIELFAKGNILLCDEEGTIISLLHRQESKERTLAVKRAYEPPPGSTNIFEAGPDEIRSLKDSSAESLVKALARDLGMGGVYAEEACIIANIDKETPPKKLAEQDINALHKAIRVIIEKEKEPKAVFRGGEMVNVVPFDLEYYESCEFVRYPSYNEALDAVLSVEDAGQRKTEHSREYTKNAEKIKNIIQKQEKSLEKANKTIEENQRKGEIIYEKYGMVKEVLDEINKAREKHSWAEIKKRLKGHKTIKSVNEKEGKVIIDI
ncbi:MAG: NFACT family protein [Candidatus Woesearchaeota archaeon]